MKPFLGALELLQKIVLSFSTIVQTVTLFLMIAHSFNIVGMIIFGDLEKTGKKGSPYQQSLGSFNSYWNGLFVLLLTATENGWSSIILDYGYKYHISWVPPLFFNVFNSIIKYVVLSLMVGLIWEVFLLISGHIKAQKIVAK